MKVSECRSCTAPVLWVTMPSGKKNPLDWEPSGVGRIVLVGDDNNDPHARMLKRDEVSTSETYQSHFSTCPDAKKFRR